MSCCCPARSQRVLRVRLAGVRPGRAAADAGLRAERPRPRHEQLDDRAVRVSRAAAGSRQGARRRGQLKRARSSLGRYKDVDGDGIRYRTLPGNRAPAGRLLHARHRPQRVRHLQRAPGRLGEQPGPAGRASTRPRARWCPRPWSTTCRRRQDRHHRLRLDRSRPSRRRATGCAEQGVETSYLRLRALPLDEATCATSSRSTTGCTWSRMNHDGQMQQLLQLRTARAAPQSLLVAQLRRPAADGAAGSPSRSPEQISRQKQKHQDDERESRCNALPRRHDMTTEVKPANASRPRTGRPTTRAATSTLCPGCGHDSITSQIINAAYELALQPRPGHQAERHRLLAARRPAYFLSRSHGFNAPARPHALGGDRRDRRQPRPDRASA